MKVITAPDIYEEYNKNDVLCFLAGGIRNCKKWQKEVVDIITKTNDKEHICDNLVLINPRRDTYDLSEDPRKQIEWEFNYLENCDIFSMYFCASESVQPICMYELGRNILRMQQRFPESWRDRVVISVETGYSRVQDVIIQSELATKWYNIVTTNCTPAEHAARILMAYTWIEDDM